MDITGLDKARVFMALYNRSRPQGMGFMHFVPGDMPMDVARSFVSPVGYYDYVAGRVMKVDLRGDYLDTRLYDRDNGVGAAEEAILEEFTKP